MVALWFQWPLDGRSKNLVGASQESILTWRVEWPCTQSSISLSTGLCCLPEYWVDETIPTSLPRGAGRRQFVSIQVCRAPSSPAHPDTARSLDFGQLTFSDLAFTCSAVFHYLMVFAMPYHNLRGIKSSCLICLCRNTWRRLSNRLGWGYTHLCSVPLNTYLLVQLTLKEHGFEQHVST